MKIKKVILYKNLNKKIVQEYSRFKFGDQIIIEKYTRELTKIIKKFIKKNRNYIIYTTNKAPLNKYCKKNSLILTEKIAKKLKLPLIVGEYNYHYNKKEFYDSSLERRIHIPIIKIIDNLKKYNYHVFIIDDSILTGNALKASTDQLNRVVNGIIFFSIIDLQKQKYSEKELNNFYYKEKGLVFLLKLLKNKNYIPTSHFIRTIDELDKEKKEWLVKNLNKKQRILLEKAFNIYTESFLAKLLEMRLALLLMEKKE